MGSNRGPFMGKPMSPPPPVYSTSFHNRYDFEMWQAMAFLQAQLPKGVIVKKIDREQRPDTNIAQWVVGLRLPTGQLVEIRENGDYLPLEAIMIKANLLGV